jgi:16S rRNA (cytosine1402-N4)-methyltransferase
MDEELHKPVMLKEVLDVLRPRRGEKYLDLTAGYGGHAGAILDWTQNYKEAVLNDRDEFAAEYLRARFSERPVEVVNDNFYNTAFRLVESGKTFDIILADFGVSSPQLDRAERGFAFSLDGPLDMRMDRRQELRAWNVVNEWSEEEIRRILLEYGEERPKMADLVAGKIVRGRPWTGTKMLADAIFHKSYGKVHPATRVFQAIRIAVNDELTEIERTLPLMTRLLAVGGRVGMISFHSLEDRLVKEYFREMSERGMESELVVLTKKPVVAGSAELVINPRARSAKFRAARRV